MKSFGILTISHGRPTVLKLFCAGIKRLREDLQIFIPCVVVGDPGHKEICDAYHIHHITMDNHPATAKWNRGVEYLMEQGCEYVTIMGSDDVMSTDLMRNLIGAMEKGYDIIGVKEIYFYAGNGHYKGILRKLDSSVNILGVARTISRRIIEQTHPMWRIPRSWGMDGDCLRTIWKYVKSSHVTTGVVVDVKISDGPQLNRFTFWVNKLKTNYPPEIFLDILSEEEKQILSQL